MKTVIFHIDSDGEHLEVSLDDEISFGRTGLAQVVLPDSGLSRLNTTIFRDGDEIFIVDENSTNGTFVNGEQVFDSPHSLSDRDEITIGTNTQIYVEIAAQKPVRNEIKRPADEKTTKPAPAPGPSADDKKLPLIPILAGVSTFAIILFAVVAILIIKWKDDGKGSNGKPTPGPVQSAAVIPIRVIDPLGGEDPDDIDDLIAILDNDIADKTVDQSELEEMQNTMTSSTAPTEDKTVAELMVKPEFFNQMINLSKEPRSPSGERPPGLRTDIKELCCGVPKQTAKLEEMVRRPQPYTQPLDFADLAERRLNGQLLELPVATQDYVLDVGGNATEEEFNEFSWNTTPRTIPLQPGSPKYQILQKLAENFGGQKYDLNNPKHRKQMKIRLLRMFNPKAKPILMEFAKAYRQKFNRPLRITSLTRSMEYQISLNGNNANSFKVRGDGSRPPHTSGCAFDLARKSMTVDEQNFMIQTLADMEKRGILDALIEYNVNACFHIFIYDDGQKPKGF
jgi:pSer/pThr/pTyr-binding forkhead associated (FHA) protein